MRRAGKGGLINAGVVRGLCNVSARTEGGGHVTPGRGARKRAVGWRDVGSDFGGGPPSGDAPVAQNRKSGILFCGNEVFAYHNKLWCLYLFLDTLKFTLLFSLILNLQQQNSLKL